MNTSAGLFRSAIRRLLMAAVFTTTIGLSTPVQACCIPYIPWLDPFAWLGFYGCGWGCCGYGGGCGYGGYGGYGGGYGGYGGGYAYGPGYGYGYAPPAYGYAPPAAPVMPYQAAPGCDCTGSVQPQMQMSAVQVPVTTYRPVTQYVP
ncbi:MAG: hypothetical protein KDA77_23015, partial [Planctomycetaceae bacterium]|nr:hypothetical protein [Planctomycetaceae bacterium]